MADLRHIRQVVKSRPALEGAGVHLHRAIGFGLPEEYDPFLLLDDFRSDDPDQYRNGFPWHPHRGMETITYVLRGEVAHGDSMGNRDAIRAGDVQCMTAGSGILPQVMPSACAEAAMYRFPPPGLDRLWRPRTGDRRGGSRCRALTARRGAAHRRARRLGGPDRDEHPGGGAHRLRRTRPGHVHQEEQVM